MTSKDKTGDQLVASIRKSKTGALAKKTSTRRAPAKSTTRTSARSTTAKASPTQSQQDSYSCGRRVWPD